MSHSSIRYRALAALLMVSVSSAGCTIAARKNRGLGFVADALVVTGSLVTATTVAAANADGDDTGASTNVGVLLIAGGAFLGLTALGAFGDPAPKPAAKSPVAPTPVIVEPTAAPR